MTDGVRDAVRVAPEDTALLGRVRESIERVIVGKSEVIELLLVALLCEGHVLLEDVPGVGKTMLAKSLARTLNCVFRRIQFTPDLLPSDITGVAVYNQKTGDFEFRPGPVFTNVLLADEINRATPRTQAALLEAMEERQVSAEGETRALPRPFLVVATQNPVELEGTFPLPEAQLDRFLLRVRLGYPSEQEERLIVRRFEARDPLLTVQPVIGPDEIAGLAGIAQRVHLSDPVLDYAVRLVRATRVHADTELGASPRATLALTRTARALAVLRGRAYVAPDDIKTLAVPVLAHRLMVIPSAQMRGGGAETLVAACTESVPVPVEQEERDGEHAAQLEVDHLIQPRWAGVLVVVVLVSAILRQPAIFFAGTVLLLALGMSWLWGRYCLDRLEYTRSFSSTTVAFGDEVTLSVTVVNRKVLPLAWVEIDDEMPRSLQLTRGELLPLWKRQRGILQQMLTLRWYERVTRRYQLRCPERGEQVFGPVELRSGDLFGLARRRRSLPARQTVLVYPKVVPVTALGLPSHFPLGDQRSRQRIFRDPLRVAGTRPYTQGDSLRQMHWKATARLGTLQVKTEEPSTTLRAMLLLNLQTTPRAWEQVSADLLELLICITASLASHLTEQRAQCGLLTNALLPHTRGGVRVPASRSPRQLIAILTVLAQITPLATTSFTDLLTAERRRVPVGATIVLITGFLDDQILDQAHAFRIAGHPVVALLVGEAMRNVTVPGLMVYWVGDEQRWRDLRALQAAVPPTER